MDVSVYFDIKQLQQTSLASYWIRPYEVLRFLYVKYRPMIQSKFSVSAGYCIIIVFSSCVCLLLCLHISVFSVCVCVVCVWVSMYTFLSIYTVLSGHVDILAYFVNKLPNFLGVTYPAAAPGLPSQPHM